MGLSMTQGNGPRVLGDVDLLSTDDLRRLAEVEGPCVTLYLPTAPFGPGTRSGPSRLHHLAGQAAGRLEGAGVTPEDAEAILAPVRELADDETFWQHQSEGLALFVARDFFDGFRLPTSLSDQVVVGDAFRLLPLVVHVAADSRFYILALTQNDVRLFEATRDTVSQLDLGGIPASLEDALPEAVAERQRGVHSIGALGKVTHGQGTEADYDKAALERYFRAIDEPLTKRLGTRGRPLVIAGVAYYLPIYRAVSKYPAVWKHAVEGSPERSSAQQLHDAAWPLVAGHFSEAADLELARYREAAGKGRTVSGTDQTLAAALEGKVETLFLDAGHAATSDDAVLEQAVVETLRRSGDIVTVGPAADLPEPAVAVLRY
jgi:hypothetical protein